MAKLTTTVKFHISNGFKSITGGQTKMNGNLLNLPWPSFLNSFKSSAFILD